MNLGRRKRPRIRERKKLIPILTWFVGGRDANVIH